MTPTNIAQYKRSATNKEVYVLTSGDAGEFRRVHPISKRSRASYAGKVYITFGLPKAPKGHSTIQKIVQRHGEDAYILGAYNPPHSTKRRETLSPLGGGRIMPNKSCRYWGDTVRRGGKSAVLVEVSADANTLTLYFFANMASKAASLFNEWCAGRLTIQDTQVAA